MLVEIGAMVLPTSSDYTAIGEAHGKVTHPTTIPVRFIQEGGRSLQIPHKPLVSTAHSSTMHQKQKSYYHQHTTILVLFTLFGLVFQGKLTNVFDNVIYFLPKIYH